MSRPWMVVHLDGYGSRIEGEWHVRQLLLEVTGRKPMRAARGVAGWVVQEATARRVLTVARARNYDVDVVERVSRKQRLWDVLKAAPAQTQVVPLEPPVQPCSPAARESCDSPREGSLW